MGSLGEERVAVRVPDGDGQARSPGSGGRLSLGSARESWSTDWKTYGGKPRCKVRKEFEFRGNSAGRKGLASELGTRTGNQFHNIGSNRFTRVSCT